MSSQDIIKAVSKKLQYYFEVKRLEDGFDLSGPYSPKLDHPPMKKRPTLMYDGLHDKPVKHYFSKHNIRQQITQMKGAPNEERESQIQKDVDYYMSNTRFVHPYLPEACYEHTPRMSRRLKAEMTGFGVPMKKSKRVFRGGYPNLRSVPPNHVTMGEAHRLVNMATKILVASETIDLELPNKKNQRDRRLRTAGTNGQGDDTNDGDYATVETYPPQRPKGSRSMQQRRRPQTAKYTYDIHGRRVPLKQKAYDDSHIQDRRNDSAYMSRDSSSDENKSSAEKKENIPFWLREQMKKVDSREERKLHNNWIRPHSAVSATPPASERSSQGPVRPWSSRPPRSETARPATRARPKSAKWHLRDDISLSSGSDLADQEIIVDADIPLVEDIGVQTGRELLIDFDHSETIVQPGDEGDYEICVRTGNRIGSSTKADIGFILYGSRGRTVETPLVDSKNHKVMFQKGQEDIFKIKMPHVGKLEKLKIGHHKTEIGSGWYLDSVTVKDYTERQSYEFSCDRWLSSREGEGITMRELKPSTSRNLSGNDSVRSPSPTSSEVSLHSEPRQRSRSQSSASSRSRSPNASSRSSSSSSRSSVRSRSKSPNQGSARSTNTSLQGNESDGAADDKADKKSFVEETEDSSSDSETESEGSVTSRNTVRQNSEKEVESVIEVEVKDDSVSNNDNTNDDFFNSKPAEKDTSYLHVRDNADTKSEKSDDKSDFESDKPQVSATTDTTQEESSDSESDSEVAVIDNPEMRDDNKNTLRIASDSENDKKLSDKEDEQKDTDTKQDDGYMAGFMAGIQASNQSNTDKEDKGQRSEEEDVEQKILQGPTIHQAAKSGDLERIKALHHHNSELIDSNDEKGNAPLHISCINGHIETVKWLAANGANLAAETPTGYSPMHLASMNGHVNCMMVLSAMGGKILIKSIDQQTPLHLASMSGHLETVKWLVANRASLDDEDFMGRTPVTLAEEYQHDEVLKFLNQCMEEQKNPRSSFALMRTNSRKLIQPDLKDTSVVATDGESIQDSIHDNKDDNPWTDDKEESHVAQSPVVRRPSDATSKATVQSEADDESSGSGSETDSGSESDSATENEDDTVAEKEKQKRHEEIEEKKKQFENLQETQQSTGLSFLDQMRAEMEG